MNRTLRNIEDLLNAHPTVLFTGNGYHVYQPIQAQRLEDIREFNNTSNPSTKFLRFAALFLSNGKSDPNNYQSIRSCMLRIPGSLNSKCPQQSAEVRVIQKWDGFKPTYLLLIGMFQAYLINENMKEKIVSRSKGSYRSDNLSWIEKLIKTPVEDFRKCTVALILAPYLLNIRKVSYDLAFSMIKEWLQKCDSLKSLDFDITHGIRAALLQAAKRQIPPMNLETLKSRNKYLYDLLKVSTLVDINYI